MDINGFGFLDNNGRLLCLTNATELALIPRAEVDPKCVIIVWKDDIEIVRSVLRCAPYLGTDRNFKLLDETILTPILLTREDDQIWIG